ncbi:hypothetical protein vseg_021586 [Gypsophila vaccaria]
MGSLGNEECKKAIKAMWLCPKLVGTTSQRWGHSSSFFLGHLYVFGGCCGGMHYSDVLVLNLETMTWSTLVTLGNGPGPRDSHSATIWGNKIVVFGGTNGSKKVNDLHILDLGTKQWIQPVCSGTPPSPRESHTATLLGDEKLVVFGGSGEGAGNYLNDLHIFNLRTMSWVSVTVNGRIPPPRDSHTSTAFDGKIFVYGGDCGDRYHGDVDVLDVETMTWSMLEINGSSPGRRAGHASVKIGTKMYTIGGVGDKKYYNDVWVLDTETCLWSKLEISGHSPQGRFSHTAVVTDSDIAIYGGCGEDERPLGELLILQLGDDHPSGQYNVKMLKTFGQHWNIGKRKGLCRDGNGLKTMISGSCIEPETNNCNELRYSDSKKLRRSANANSREKEFEPDEHSLSVSQNSSPSQSDQEQTTLYSPTISHGIRIPSLNHLNKSPRHNQSDECVPQQKLPDMYIIGENRADMRRGNLFSSSQGIRDEAGFLTSETRPVNYISNQNLIGADVQGKVDGAFDSGYLMTATVNGRSFRGVLFAAAPNMMSRGANQSQSTPCVWTPPSQLGTNFSRGSIYRRNPTNQLNIRPSQGCRISPRVVHEKANDCTPVIRAVSSRDQELRDRSDLQGVVLTLGAPAFSHK